MFSNLVSTPKYSFDLVKIVLIICQDILINNNLLKKIKPIFKRTRAHFLAKTKNILAKIRIFLQLEFCGKIKNRGKFIEDCNLNNIYLLAAPPLGL